MNILGETTSADRKAADAAFDIAFRGETGGIDDAMAQLFARHRSEAVRIKKDLNVERLCAALHTAVDAIYIYLTFSAEDSAGRDSIAQPGDAA